MKHLQLPSGLQSGLPLVIDDDWSTEQVVAVPVLASISTYGRQYNLNLSVKKTQSKPKKTR